MWSAGEWIAYMLAILALLGLLWLIGYASGLL
jgi:hypothetical protein